MSTLPRLILGILLIGALTIRLTATAPTPVATPDGMNQLYADYWEEFLRANPIMATFVGDNRFNDRYGATTSAEDRKATRELAKKYLQQTTDLDPIALPPEDRISYDLFRYQLRADLESLNYPSHLLPINQMSSMHLILAQFGSGQLAQPFKTVQDYDNWLARVADFAPYVEGIIADIRTGIEQGIVLPKALAKPIIPQLTAIGTPDLTKNVFMKPVNQFPEGFSDEDQIRLTAAYNVMVGDEIVPAYQRLHDFLKNEYLPACRDTVGLSDLPGGAEWYAFKVRTSTTTDLTPEQIHEIGLKEVARIRTLMEEAKKSVGFDGSLADFYRHLDEDPTLKFQTREEMQAAYEGMRERVSAAVPQFFGRTPKTPFEIRQMEAFREKSAPPAQYNRGLPDGSRPGIFYFNAYQPETRSRYTTEAFFAHEAIPGHHFELSLASEQAGLPAFRRFGGETAYSEGWGLYSEMLGKEMGLYVDPYQWVGRLSAEIWRACRLVIDTGLHAKGWTREQSIAYFLENTPQNEAVAIQEVERYIAIPGQALSYKIGELKLLELRARAETTLGDDFDIRAFHDEILAHGSVPLSVLESAVDRWIAAQKN